MKSRKFWVIVVSLLSVVLVLGLGAMWFVSSHTFVDGKAYRSNAESLDLRNKDITIEHFEAVQAALPDCEIAWCVPFQDGALSNDAQKISVTSLTEADLDTLEYFTQLQSVDARGCTDYDQIVALQDRYPELAVQYTVTVDGQEYPQDATAMTVSSLTEEEAALTAYLPNLTSVNADNCSDYAALAKLQALHPDCAVTYSVPVSGKTYTQDTTSLSLTGASTAELMEYLAYLPNVTKVDLMDPVCDGDGLLALVEAYPNIQFYWEANALGLRITSTDTQLDLSSVPLSSLEQAEEALAIFPALERVYFGYNRFDNEMMAAFREKMRDQYKVAWSLDVGYLVVNSDDTWFMPGKFDKGLTDEQSYNLKYCEDMICIDVGHKSLNQCEFVAYMPHLKYLVIAFTCITDITPLTGLKELIYLEVCRTYIEDYSPLETLTALEDLNVSNTWADNPECITRMTWLKRLWWHTGPYTDEELREFIPGLEAVSTPWVSTSIGLGWRDADHYREMRDILGMYYMF